MPCTPGMRACRADCRHRERVQAYYAERDQQAERAEAVTHGYPTELAAYFGDDGEGSAVEQRWTFHRWLIVTAEPQPDDDPSVTD